MLSIANEAQMALTAAKKEIVLGGGNIVYVSVNLVLVYPVVLL